MQKKILFSMESPYRDTFRIWGYHFGSEEKTIAIVGAMRGDEVQQQYICSQLVRQLQEIEKEGLIAKGVGILVIPSANPFSMNIGKRFWAMDNTDINRMFPGYNLGETTQRIASGLFEAVKDYQYGIQLASYYLPGEFIPHIKMIKTGYEDTEGAKLFGLPYVCLKETIPFDTTTLNYNWQIWDAKAYMVFGGQNSDVGTKGSRSIIGHIISFLKRKHFLKEGNTSLAPHPDFNPVVIEESKLTSLYAESAGIFERLCSASDEVRKGELIANIIDPYDGTVLSEVRSPKDGVIFYALNQPLALLNTPLFRIL